MNATETTTIRCEICGVDRIDTSKERLVFRIKEVDLSLNVCFTCVGNIDKYELTLVSNKGGLNNQNK